MCIDFMTSLGYCFRGKSSSEPEMGLIQYVFLTLTVSVWHIYGYSSGAPSFTCPSMMPSHGSFKPKTNPARYYQITSSTSSYTPGESVSVTITALNGEQFKGYLIRAQDEGTGNPVGTFRIAQGGKLQCGPTSNEAVTHTTGALKTTETFTWMAPANAIGNIVFVATIVKSYKDFWTDVRSSPVSVAVTTQETTTALDTTKVTATTKLVTPTTVSEVTEKAPVTGALMMDARCGDTWGCFVNCQGTACQYVASWHYHPDYVDFSIERVILGGGGGQKWVAIGFSDDKKMGHDDVLHCISDAAGHVMVGRSFNLETSNQPIHNPHEGISRTTGSYRDGVFRCSFRYSQVSDQSNKRKRQATTRPMIDLSHHRHIMLGDGQAFGDMLGMHTVNPVVTPHSVDIRSTNIIGDVARYPLVKVHGCLMILAWIFCTGVGLIFARFYKPVWSDRTILGLKVWFQFHRGLMVTTLVLTLVGFIIIFVEANGYSKISAPIGKAYLQSHPILGIIVTILVVANPVMALFRPGPKDKNRPIFNWAHLAVGMAAHILAVITICFGVELQKVGAPKYTVYVVVGYIVYHILMEIMLKLYDLFADRQNTARIEQMEMKNGNGTTLNGNSFRPEEPKRDPKDSTIKKLLLVFHVAIVFAFTLTLLLLVTQY
ncbi:putative ferric-chelate reductase 1 isoform X2 [Saccostrea echinata]|uniref:putative ferric-chelate reductase 1 isoform X2 n=1 Tax=Saccostrea echinata TaxID=191078 RepID=UPI002A7EB43F|nr:putative ferric-chelate reductase 1 isoform X2 [Saccostrea echinata]